MTKPEPHAADTDPQDTIEEGMQGADGNADASGLDPHADREAKLRELEENLSTLQTGKD